MKILMILYFPGTPSTKENKGLESLQNQFQLMRNEVE